MAIPRKAFQQLQDVVDAGHPDHALVGMPVGLVREILSILPVEVVDAVIASQQPSARRSTTSLATAFA